MCSACWGFCCPRLSRLIINAGCCAKRDRLSNPYKLGSSPHLHNLAKPVVSRRLARAFMYRTRFAWTEDLTQDETTNQKSIHPGRFQKPTSVRFSGCMPVSIIAQEQVDCPNPLPWNLFPSRLSSSRASRLARVLGMLPSS